MKVIVGMSGGVDSTIAAYILKKQGHEVIGVYFDFLNENDKISFKIDEKSMDYGPEFSNLFEISKKLCIDIYYKNFKKEFDEKVVAYFISEYKNASTPNPCAFCNGNMKFTKLLDAMKEFKCDMCATGHYANVVKENRRFAVSKSKNATKDQSYMLYTLNQEVLSKLIFPIGNMEKEDVRNKALELNLDVANKKDSQDVCFISGDYKEFIKKQGFTSSKGEFVSTDGRVLGFHDGIINYTVGQRKGLNIPFGERKFVIDIDAKENKIVLGKNKDLMSRDFDLKDVVYQFYDENTVLDKFTNRGILGNIFGEKLLCKVRYRHEEESCIIDKNLHCKFKKPVRAITRGQAAVFYNKKGYILFGGTIIKNMIK